VYANTTEGESYLGQVQADLDVREFAEVPDGATVTLYAFPDNQKQCVFEYFETYPPGVTPITVSATGALPIAFFHCP
jgi:hypothetical protein